MVSPFNRSNLTLALSAAGVAFMLTPTVAPAAAAGPPATATYTEPDFDRWMYPFNSTPGTRGTASTFGAFGEPDFDNRDGQFHLGWVTAPTIPAGLGASSYDIQSVTVTIEVSNDLVTEYDTTVDEWTAFLDRGDPNFVEDRDPGQPFELFGIGYRNGFDIASFGETGPYSPGGPFGKGVRNAFAADFDAANTPIDVSNSVDEGYTAAPWSVGMIDGLTPGDLIPESSLVRFQVDLSQGAARAYVQRGLDGGELRLAVTSHTLVVQQGGEFVNFFTKENALVQVGVASAAQLEIVWQEASTTPCPADFDVSGSVDFNDLVLLLSQFGACEGCPPDLDGDMDVDFSDLVALLAVYGPCP